MQAFIKHKISFSCSTYLTYLYLVVINPKIRQDLGLKLSVAQRLQFWSKGGKQTQIHKYKCGWKIFIFEFFSPPRPNSILLFPATNPLNFKGRTHFWIKALGTWSNSLVFSDDKGGSTMLDFHDFTDTLEIYWIRAPFVSQDIVWIF